MARTHSQSASARRRRRRRSSWWTFGWAPPKINKHHTTHSSVQCRDQFDYSQARPLELNVALGPRLQLKSIENWLCFGVCRQRGQQRSAADPPETWSAFQSSTKTFLCSKLVALSGWDQVQVKKYRLLTWDRETFHSPVICFWSDTGAHSKFAKSLDQ